MNQQPRWPQVMIQRSPDCCDFAAGAGDYHQPKLASGNMRQELWNLNAFVEIRRTFASNVIGRAAEIHSHEFEHVGLINTVRGYGERQRKPGTTLLHFCRIQSQMLLRAQCRKRQ